MNEAQRNTLENEELQDFINDRDLTDQAGFNHLQGE